MNPCIFCFLKNRNRLLAFYLTKKFLICFIVIKNICWIRRNMVSLFCVFRRILYCQGTAFLIWLLRNHIQITRVSCKSISLHMAYFLRFFVPDDLISSTFVNVQTVVCFFSCSVIPADLLPRANLLNDKN